MEYVKQVCKIGQQKDCCRYLTAGSQGFSCAKHTSLKSLLDNRVLNNEMIAQGDNCAGYPQDLNLNELPAPASKTNVGYVKD